MRCLLIYATAEAMKIVEHTGDRLTIEDRPWFLWLFLPPMALGAILTALTGQYDSWGETLLVLALGLGMSWVVWKFMPFQRFVFDRPSGAFTHRVHRVTGSQSWTLDLSEIELAISGPYWIDGSRLERVVLKTNSGRYPLESGFTGLSRTKIVNAINGWLSDRSTHQAP